MSVPVVLLSSEPLSRFSSAVAGFGLPVALKTDLNMLFHRLLIVGCESRSGDASFFVFWPLGLIFFPDGVAKGTSPSNESKTGAGLLHRIIIILRPGAGVQGAEDKAAPWPSCAMRSHAPRYAKGCASRSRRVSYIVL